MSREDLHRDILDAMVDLVLQRVENCVKGLHPDLSATAEKHKVGFESGFAQAKREMLAILDGVAEEVS